MSRPVSISSLLIQWVVAGLIATVAAAAGCSGEISNPPLRCASGELVCGRSCVEASVDPNNCGACGVACAQSEVCDQGACSLTCSASSKKCDRSCVDVSVDRKNCGACAAACGVGELCAAGVCKAQCPGSQTLCVADGGAISCVNPASDGANCGGCGVQCSAGKVCSSGKCGDSCTSNTVFCSGDGGAPYCAPVATDNANCGACGIACGAGQACIAGKCLGNCGGGGVLCPGGDGGAPFCALLQTDNANCGTCGLACGSGKKCVAGSCVLECSVGLTLCASACLDLQSDRDNCGSCAFACGAGLSCSGGKCSVCSNVNAALTAVGSTSGGGAPPSYGPSNLNDGVLEVNKCATYSWITASNSPGGAWAQYTWSAAKTLVKMHLDTQSATVTNSCQSVGRTMGAAKVQWWNGASWITDGQVVALDDWDYTFSSPVTTTQVRLFDLYATNTLGQQSNPVIFEWQVTGCN